MKILVVTNKYETRYLRFETERERGRAALSVFYANDMMHCYSEIADPVLKSEKRQGELYAKAKRDDATAAWELLKLRRDYEYEGFEIKELE